MQKTVVITGAGSSLGRILSLEMAQRGYKVFGTASSQAQIDDLAAASGGVVTLIICNITDVAQVKSFAEKCMEAADSKIDILISNAGTLTPGPLETIAPEAVLKEFAVNTFGVLTVVNAFLPALRAAKGRILQMSTRSVDFPSPFNGLSAASKGATEALMDVYRAELAAAGVEVVVAVAGNLATGGPAKTAAAIDKVRGSFTPQQKELYGETFDNFASRINTGQANGLDAHEAARQIADLAEKTPAPVREPIGDDAREMIRYVKESTPEEQAIRRRQSI